MKDNLKLTDLATWELLLAGSLGNKGLAATLARGRQQSEVHQLHSLWETMKLGWRTDYFRNTFIFLVVNDQSKVLSRGVILYFYSYFDFLLFQQMKITPVQLEWHASISQVVSILLLGSLSLSLCPPPTPLLSSLPLLSHTTVKRSSLKAFSCQFGLIYLLQPLSQLIRTHIIKNSISGTLLNTHTHVTSLNTLFKMTSC